MVDEDMRGLISLGGLLELHKTIWKFRIDPGDPVGDIIAREQLRSYSQISQIGSLSAIPVSVYLMTKLFLHADAAFIAFALFYMAIITFLSIKGFYSHAYEDENLDAKKVFDGLRAEAIINGIGFASLLAFPLAFGQIPVGLDLAVIAMGAVLLGSFIYGSIPQVQSYYMAIMTTGLAAGFLINGGWNAIGMVSILVFNAFCTDYIYRLFFFNFAQRHKYAAKQREAAETVRLLLNDYAEQSSDWLWEVDANGYIINPSARFAAAVDREIGDLRGMALVNLFANSTERNRLTEELAAGEAFRDHKVPITINGKNCWWKLSGRPMRNADGVTSHIRGVAADITEAKNAEERVAHLAHFDSLTDLPNRALFNQVLARSLHRSRNQKLAILYIDVDHFKGINDTLGHGAGDLVLKAVASRLEYSVGIENMVARLGGDEFAVSLRNIETADAALDRANTIIEQLCEPVMVEGQPVSIGVSVGIAVSPDNGKNVDDLMRHADIALYHAKENGRGRAALFEVSMGEAVRDRRKIEMDLRTALQNDELELQYQPLINIETRATLGYEALLRWNHPERGLIMPDVFIPVAEDTGLIVPLGEWVLRTALEEMTKWPEHLSVAVNLSPTQMRSDNLLPTIVNALAASGIAPERLELEITESVLMNDSQDNVELLHKIRSLGVRIALDDFGTGYSSLNYLRSFPFDKIKIDRCFVDEVDSREDCRAIIRAVTGLASSLGMITTAEGVERDDQLSKLREEGCLQVQGYLFSKAIQASEVEGRADVVDTAVPQTLAALPPKGEAATGDKSVGQNTDDSDETTRKVG